MSLLTRTISIRSIDSKTMASRRAVLQDLPLPVLFHSGCVGASLSRQQLPPATGAVLQSPIDLNPCSMNDALFFSDAFE